MSSNEQAHKNKLCSCVKHGIRSDRLMPEPNCPLCGGSGYEHAPDAVEQAADALPNALERVQGWIEEGKHEQAALYVAERLAAAGVLRRDGLRALDEEDVAHWLAESPDIPIEDEQLFNTDWCHKMAHLFVARYGASDEGRVLPPVESGDLIMDPGVPTEPAPGQGAS